jgi:hypothetical protein
MRIMFLAAAALALPPIAGPLCRHVRRLAADYLRHIRDPRMRARVEVRGGDGRQPRCTSILQISVQDKTITATRPSGAAVNAKIDLVRHAEGQTFLQGIEETRGWSMAINEAKGNMSLAIHDDASSYVIFGACTPR